MPIALRNQKDYVQFGDRERRAAAAAIRRGDHEQHEEDKDEKEEGEPAISDRHDVDVRLDDLEAGEIKAKIPPLVVDRASSDPDKTHRGGSDSGNGSLATTVVGVINNTTGIINNPKVVVAMADSLVL